MNDNREHDEDPKGRFPRGKDAVANAKLNAAAPALADDLFELLSNPSVRIALGEERCQHYESTLRLAGRLAP